MTPIKEIEFERIYDAPIDRVWSAWTNPEEIKMWWGPDNVTIPECELELEIGGRIYIVMEAGEEMGPYKGTRWPMEGTVTQLVPQSLLSYSVKAWTEGNREATEIDQYSEIHFEDNQGTTVVKVKATINKIGPKSQMAVEGMKYGFDQQLNKLTQYLK